MEIYDAADALLLKIDVDDDSYRYRAVAGDDNMVLKYSLAEHVELPVGAYCEYQSRRYTLMRPEAIKMQHTRRFEYTVTLEAPQYRAKMWKFRNTADRRLKFPLTAKPREHLQMFVDNMNGRDPGWAIGSCIEGDEHLISYDHDYCWDALSRMASEFDTEFEIVDRTVSLGKVEYNKDNPLPLAYGKGNGFRSGVGRANDGDNPPTETLYVQGGTQNIDRSRYPAEETLRASANGSLLLPRNAAIGYDGSHFDDEEGYDAAAARLYATDGLGLSVRRADLAAATLAEDSLDCSDCYPKRVGTVSAVVCVSEEDNFYDFTDDTIPDTLDYGDCLIPGETMTVIFQSGMLAGREFEVKYVHNATSSKQGRRFEIVPQEEDGITMPGGAFVPVAGDRYAIFHCMLPDAYIADDATRTGAEWDMLRKAVRHLHDRGEQKYTFTGELDGIWAKKDWENIGGRIVPGGYVSFTDARFQPDPVLIRIVGIKDYVNKPHSPELELSNATAGGSFAARIATLASTEVVVEENRREAERYARRRFRDATEAMQLLEQSLLGTFSSSVSPVAVRTMQLLAGDESLQFRFVDNADTPEEAAHNIAYDAAARRLSCPAGLIQHMTLGVSDITAARPASAYKYWRLPAYESAVLDDAQQAYYLYAMVGAADNGAVGSGEFRLEREAQPLERTGGGYALLVGILNSESGGDRSFATLYGFTEILPGRITTDRVVSTDGRSFFDLADGTMALGDKLRYDGSALHLDFLFADGANIANLIFRNQRLESTARDGSTPNFYIDGKTGEASFAQGKVVFSADGSARIGWVYIDEDDLVGVDDDGAERLRITPGTLPPADTASETSYPEFVSVTTPTDGAEATNVGPTEFTVLLANALHDGGDDTHPDGTDTCSLTAYVVFDVSQPGATLYLGGDGGGIQYAASMSDAKGAAIADSAISHLCTATVHLSTDGGATYATRVGAVALSSGQRTIVVPAAGRVRVTVRYSIEVTGYSYWKGSMRIFCDEQGGLVSETTTKKQTFIAADGIMSIYNSNYMRFHSTDGFAVKVGSYGLRVTPSGVQKMTDGASWTAL